MRINIEQPLILLLIPAGIFLLIFSARFMHLRSKELKIKQIILRGIVFSLMILALSGVSLLQKGKNIATVFIVDASDSAKEHSEYITEFINNAIGTKSAQDHVGIVTVGKLPSLENFVSDKCIYHGAQTPIDPSATNLEDAVNLAMSMMPEGFAKRIVIISDGAENVGSLKDTVADVTMAGCDVKTVTLPSSLSEEVYVSNLTIPENVGTGEMFKVMVEVESNVSTTAVVSLYQGRTLTERKTVNLSKGTSLIPFYDTQTDAGLKTYKVTVEALNDTFSLNNEYSAFTNISVKQPLLLLEGRQDFGRPLYDMLSKMGLDCILMSASSAPTSISELMEYSGVVLCNVSVIDLPDDFLSIITSYVKDYGKGLIACGGRHAFAPGLYKDTALETLLPVNMDINGEAELPSMAIMFVIDKSGSMSGDKLYEAKSAAIKSLDLLRDEDSVGVISFDTYYTKVFPLSKIDGHRDEVASAIGTIDIEGGTSIYPAVRAAADDLLKYKASVKHIVLLTDGQDGYSQYDPLIKQLIDHDITLSTIALGNDCNTQLLTSIAEATGGRMSLVTSNSDLPQIFAEEIYLSNNEYLIDNPGPVYITSNDDVIREVVEEGVPGIKAYVATTVKERATQLLETQEGHPLLSYWQYGLGKTVAWTSDVTGNWSGDFFAWKNNPLLWNNLIQLITEKKQSEGSYATVTQNQSSATVTYHTDDFSSNTTVKAVITDDAGNSKEVDLLPKAPGDFSTDFDLTSEGVYSIAIKQFNNGAAESVLTTAAIKKYSPEYTFNPDITLLSDYARLTGGAEIDSPSQVFTENLQLVKAMKDITVPILLAALLLFVLDIAYRRFRFRIVPEGFYANMFKRFKDKKTSTGVASKSSKKTVETESADKDDKKNKSDKGNKKKPPRSGSSKKKEPDIIDTSLLLNRMKK